MKCIRCQTDNTLKDRTANYGRCKNCRHPFVFEPTTMETTKITDGMLAKAIADLSANDTLYFTPQQLLYLLDKRLHGKSTYKAIPVLMFWGAGTLFTLVFPILSRIPFVPLFIPGLINLITLLILRRFSTNRSMTVKARRMASHCLIIQGIGLLAIGLLLGLFTGSFPVFAFGVILGTLGTYLGVRGAAVQQNTAQRLLLDVAQVQRWLDAWQAVNPIAKLLPPPKENALPAAINPDVTAYSFDRLVVTDTAAIAQLLIANNFHFENNSAILSITGYPRSIFQTTMEMLRRNPDLKVYVFHDCSGRGLNVVHQVKTNPRWFGETNVEIFDVGLMPRQVIRLPNVVIQQAPEFARDVQQLPPTVRQHLSADELAWLEDGNEVVLESFTPQRLIQALNRGIAGSRELLQGSSDAGSDMIWVDSGFYYSVDSFG